jgi:nitrate/nitrite transporter NarK
MLSLVTGVHGSNFEAMRVALVKAYFHMMVEGAAAGSAAGKRGKEAEH